MKVAAATKCTASQKGAANDASEMPDPTQWRLAAEFIGSLVLGRAGTSLFDDMTKAEIKMERFKSRGLI